ncbi:hypothetical protein IAF30_21220, partial [Acinetobacter baumannii]|nr:hypothetical protein [Acinetobacter baumannii]
MILPVRRVQGLSAMPEIKLGPPAIVKRQELERHLEDVMSVELKKWQSENKLCVSDVNIRLANVNSLG